MEKNIEEKKYMLAEAALKALPASYAPYSHFHVAAALLAADGTVYIGNNIENASYSACVCAERTAFFKAVSQGQRSFEAIAICGGLEGKAEDYCPPCGVCRQVLREFAPELEIICLNGAGEERVFTLPELLPHRFGPEYLL